MFHEQVKKVDFKVLSSRILDTTVSRSMLMDVLQKAERLDRLEAEDLVLLLNSKVWDAYKPLIKETAHRITVQRHGRTMRFYAPIYLSNECNNGCIYCGFNKDNHLKRVTLSQEEIIKEAEVIKGLGIEHLLMVSGECPKTVGCEYLSRSAKALGGMFSSLSVEVAPMGTEEYSELFNSGVDGVICYQETYDPEKYKECHPVGPKRDYEKRLDTLDRAGSAGMRALGLGVLLGLSDFRAETMFLALHARYLEKKYWRSLVSVSFPRIRPSESGFNPPRPVSDDELLHMISVLRLYLPDANLLLSTRESPAFRDEAVFYGINQMSGGSKTNPLGYSEAGSLNGEQFSISDERSPREIAEKLSKMGYDPVFKDWDRGFRSEQ